MIHLLESFYEKYIKINIEMHNWLVLKDQETMECLTPNGTSTSHLFPKGSSAHFGREGGRLYEVEKVEVWRKTVLPGMTTHLHTQTHSGCLELNAKELHKTKPVKIPVWIRRDFKFYPHLRSSWPLESRGEGAHYL